MGGESGGWGGCAQESASAWEGGCWEGKKLKRPGLCGGKEREREREKRNLPPLSLCRPNQPQPGHPRPRFVRYKLSARIPKLVLSPFPVLRSRTPQQQAVSPGRGLVLGLGLGLGLSFLLLVFLRLLPVAYDLRHATTLVSRLHSRLLFFVSLLPSFYDVDSTKKKKGLSGHLSKKIRRAEFRRFRGGGGESKAAGNTHRKKRQKMMRM